MGSLPLGSEAHQGWGGVGGLVPPICPEAYVISKARNASTVTGPGSQACKGPRLASRRAAGRVSSMGVQGHQWCCALRQVRLAVRKTQGEVTSK